MPFTGMFLWNRVVWCSVGVAALIAVYLLFPMSAEALTARTQQKTEEDRAGINGSARSALPQSAARGIDSLLLFNRRRAVSFPLPHLLPQYLPRDSLLGHHLRHGRNFSRERPFRRERWQTAMYGP
jgi:hypothetical protein